MSEPRKLSHKLKVWFSEYWNISNFLAILLFLAGLALRWHPEPYRTAGRISYCLDLIFWFIRLMDLLAVNQHAGPYLTIVTKMVGLDRRPQTALGSVFSSHLLCLLLFRPVTCSSSW